jgi:hypothetical protein
MHGLGILMIGDPEKYKDNALQIPGKKKENKLIDKNAVSFLCPFCGSCR